MISLKKTVCNT